MNALDRFSLNVMKNITPKQLALAISALLGIISFVVLILIDFFSSYWGNRFFSTKTIIGLSIGQAILGYILFYLALERFIYRKIKLIYKNIHQLKQLHPSTPPTVDMNRNIMDEVETQVLEWAAEKKMEIEQLKKMEQYRREFLGNVSHELKTPIYNIQGYLDTLLDADALADSENALRFIQKAMKNTERLAAIVQDLEIISRYEAGELQLHTSNFNIYYLLREVIESMEVLAAEKKITLQFKEGIEKNVVVNADREQIRQVISNLLTNSIRYGAMNGKTFVGIYDMDQQVLIEVTDNGIGIEAKHLPRLFERFYRVDTSRSRSNKYDGGSGLGLAIAKHIIEAHHQSIHVRSKFNIGTTFGFTLRKS